MEILNLIKKYGIYIVAALAIVFNFGVHVTHSWVQDAPTWVQIDTVLLFLGIGSFRGKLSDIFAGVDLGPVGAWINGKKTYIEAVVGVILALGPTFGWFTLDNEIVKFALELLAALGAITTATALKSYQKLTLRIAPSAEHAFRRAA